jgi:hypothetical protein
MKNYAERKFNPLQQFWQSELYISENTCKRQHKRHACPAKWLNAVRFFTLTTTLSSFREILTHTSTDAKLILKNNENENYHL